MDKSMWTTLQLQELLWDNIPPHFVPGCGKLLLFQFIPKVFDRAEALPDQSGKTISLWT